MQVTDARADTEFTAFVRANTAALLRTAYLLTGSPGAAEELLQDTLVRLYPKWARVEAAAVPMAYVRRSLANAYVNDRRRPAARRELSVESVPETGPAGSAGPDELARVADREQVWALLHALPARQRAALVLRYFHDLPDEEIGACLHCRTGTVRSLLSRGLAALREQARDGAGPEPDTRRTR